MTKWDEQIVAELRADADALEARIAGRADGEVVRAPWGDARPITVREHKADIARMRADADRIAAQG